MLRFVHDQLYFCLLTLANSSKLFYNPCPNIGPIPLILNHYTVTSPVSSRQNVCRCHPFPTLLSSIHTIHMRKPLWRIRTLEDPLHDSLCRIFPRASGATFAQPILRRTWRCPSWRTSTNAALIRYFVQLLWECVLTLLPSDVFHVIWDYTRTFAHTEFYISYLDLYLEWLCYYWAIAAKSRETRISLLPMLFLELKPNWSTISMKTARLHRTLLTNTVTVSSEKSTGIGLSGKPLPLAIPPTLFYTYTTLQERHFVRRGVPMRFWWSWFKLTRDLGPGSGLLCVCLN